MTGPASRCGVPTGSRRGSRHPHRHPLFPILKWDPDLLLLLRCLVDEFHFHHLLCSLGSPQLGFVLWCCHGTSPSAAGSALRCSSPSCCSIPDCLELRLQRAYVEASLCVSPHFRYVLTHTSCFLSRLRFSRCELDYGSLGFAVSSITLSWLCITQLR